MRKLIGFLLTGALVVTLGCTQPKPSPAVKGPVNTGTEEIKPGLSGGGQKGKGLPDSGDEGKNAAPPAKKDTTPVPPAKKG